MTKLEETYKVIQTIRGKSDSCIIFCSFGKDSLVTLDLVYPHFNRVVCLFMYFVKDLEHINRWINWAKARYPKIEIMQVPHWNLTYILRSGMYCVPNPKIKLLKLADVVMAIRKKTGIYFTFLGMKKADSMNRRLMLMTYEECENNGNVYPLSCWTQKDILSYMRMKRLPEPVRYGKRASNGIGFNEDCFMWLKDNYPQDLKKIISVFPMSERIIYEHDKREQSDGIIQVHKE